MAAYPRSMQPQELAARARQMIVRPELLPEQVHRAATQAMHNALAAVVVPAVWVQRLATMLRGSGVLTHAVVAFPHGTGKSTIKAIEATSCIKDGADGICMVAWLPNLIRRDLDAIKFELLEVARAARSTRRDVTLDVIIETALLARNSGDGLESTLASACQAVRESAGDGIITASGFHPAGGATVQALTLLRRHAQGLTLTAAGGIDDIDTARMMLQAGADGIASERAGDLVVELART